MADNPFLQNEPPSPAREVNPFRQQGTTPEPSNVPVPAAEMTSEGEPWWSLDTWQSLGKSFIAGLTDLVGLPFDLVNPLLSAAGLPTAYGSNDLQSFLANYGLTYEPGQEPETFNNTVARLLGGLVVPEAGGRLLANRLARTLTYDAAATPSVVRGVVEEMFGAPAQTARLASAGRATGRALTRGSRTGAAVGERLGSMSGVAGATLPVLGAAGGAEIASAMYPKSEVARSLGMLAGGLAPGALALAPLSLSAKGALAFGKKTIFPYTEAGARPRAARRLQEAVPNPRQALQRTNQANFVEGAQFTPGRASGDRTLLGIERTLARENPDIAEQVATDRDVSTQAALAASDLGGDTGAARRVLETQRQETIDELARRAQQAAEDAIDAQAAVEPGLRLTDISRGASRTIEAAFERAREAEQRIWGRIPGDVETPIPNTLQVLKELKAEYTDFDELIQVPEGLQRTVLKTEESTPSFIAVRRLRTQVRTVMDRERAVPGTSKDAVYDLNKLYQALTEDMTNIPGFEGVTARASRVSSIIANKFKKGAVGKVLGFTKTGTRKVEPQDVIADILSGRIAQTKLQSLLKAAPQVTPEIKDYMRAKFLLATTQKGTFDKNAAQRFLSSHKELMDLLPGLKSELSDVRRMTLRSEALGKRLEKTKRLAYHARQSRAALYLEAPLGEEWATIMRSHDPADAARGLYRRVSGDSSAVQGLKTSYVEYLLKRSRVRAFLESGAEMRSGNRFAALVENNRKVFEALGFTDEEMQRLDQIANTLARVEQTATAKPVTTDRPSAFMQRFAQVLGAQGGAALGTGQGGSIQTANIASRTFRNVLEHLTVDKGSAMVAEAVVKDKDLFKALMLGPTASAARKEQAGRLMLPWVVVPLSASLEDTGQQRPKSQPIRLKPITITPGG